MERTYLDACLKNGLTARWPDSAMPIRVYISPFRWYEKSKQRESTAYNQMVLECFQAWQRISGERVRFQLVPSLNLSQISIEWRRVDRTSLGDCTYMINKQSMVYSAEIRIGISDGLVHARYNNADEVRHTILHEIGHALGLLDHSDHPEDIMYVPHQYGVTALSERDAATLQTLYKLPVGFDYQTIGENKYQLDAPFTLHDVLDLVEGRKPRKTAADPFLAKSKPLPQRPEELARHHDILSNMGRFHLSTQNIQVDPEFKKRLLQDNIKRQKPKPED